MWSAPRWPDREPDRRAEWDEVKRRTDILDLAHKLLGEGRKKGPATWFRCFAHEDQTPSLAVYPETQHFHTFCCSMHGDCIDLARHALRLTSFQATMAVLAEWAGVTNRTVAIAKDGEIVEVQP
jgi:DNA primase